MRKLLIILFTIFVLISFSSCDALLEGFFPEFGEDYGGEEPQFASLDIYVDVSDLNANPVFQNFNVHLYIIDETELGKGLEIPFKVGNGNFNEVIQVPRHEFTVFAYVEMDNDNHIDTDNLPYEPSDYASYWDSTNNKNLTTCDLTNNDVGNYIFVDLNLSEYKQEVPDMDQPNLNN